jgi:hypothetical protein
VSALGFGLGIGQTTTNINNPPVTVQHTVPEAVVEIGPVPITDSDAKYITGTDGEFIPTDYMISNRYEWDPHRYMAGMTSPGGFSGGKVAFFQLASPTILWICDWTASSTKKQPNVPNIKPIDPNWILLDVIPETAAVPVLAGGNVPLYRITGTYVYGHLNPSDDVFRHVCYGRPPYIEDAFTRTVDPATFQDLLKDTHTPLTSKPAQITPAG